MATGLTVTVVAGIDIAFQSLHLCKLGQHLGEGAAALVRRGGARGFDAVVSLRKLQRQIPERLHRVRLVLAGQTRHLRDIGRGGNGRACELLRSTHSSRTACQDQLREATS